MTRRAGEPAFEHGPLNINWYVWRPVIRQIATYAEIMQHWTINDLADAHEALDLQDAADAFYADWEAKKLRERQ